MNIKIQKTLAKRLPPQNISKKDNQLFEKEYYKLIPSSKVKKLKNIYVSDSKLKKFRYFRFNIKHWRMNPVKINSKIRFFLQDVLTFIKTGTSSEVIKINKGTWIIDSRSNQYFHWLTDAMQRLNVSSEFHEKYPILLTANFENLDFIKDTLKLLNKEYIILEQDKEYLIKEFILSERVSPAGNYKKEIIMDVSNVLKKSIDNNNLNKQFEKVWISRQSAPKRKISNFEIIKPILINNGFKILEYEKLTLEMQISISNNCKVLGGIHGAGLTNMLFMNKGCSLIEVRAEGDAKNNCFFSLASDLEMKYYYFLARPVNNDFYSGDYEIDSDSFNKFLNSLKVGD
jgi:capsular polysaccharide biosynthesis protein